MTEYHVHRAQDIGDKRIEPATIVISSPFPKAESIGESDALHEHCAAKLADVLCATLPGGTLDRLTAELCQRMASSLVVRRP